MKDVNHGGWIGIIGGGQLGQMMAMSAYAMGYKVMALDPDPDAPLCQIANDRIIASYDDPHACDEMARKVSVVTYEFENVDVHAVQRLESQLPVAPNSRLLAISQNRIREKSAFRQMGLHTANFSYSESRADRVRLFEQVRYPLIVKTAEGGYDGKGQSRAGSAEELAQVIAQWPEGPLIAEEVIPFDAEISVVLTRDWQGRIEDFGAIENHHKNGILDVSVAPARVSPLACAEAIDGARRIADTLELVGTMAVEFFVLGDAVLVNEMAPRPHNSGHLSIEAFTYSQYDQHIRAIAGLPLGSLRLVTPAAMVNVMGDMWQGKSGTPNIGAALKVPGTYVHLYGKTEPRVARKMGHITAVASTVEIAEQHAVMARAALEE